MQVPVRTIEGETDGEVELPAVFESEYRPDLIRKAVLAAQANRKQDYGADEYAGMRTPAESFGSGRGMAHVPREGGRGRRVPQTVGGRPAHPPKAEKDRSLDINDKERKKAIRSAIAATTDPELVAERGHDFDDDVELPVVVSDDFEEVYKTKEAAEMVDELRDGDADVQVLFLEADDDELVRRYSETRRRHPMAGDDGTVREGIQRERNRLEELRDLADVLVDTSEHTVHTLKKLVQQRYAGDRSSQFSITLLSFGFKHGLPAECDLVFDLRFLSNPYFVEGLREQDGRDQDIQEYVLAQPEAGKFISLFQEMSEFILPQYEQEGKSYLTIGFGCTGGHHRSVSMSEAIATRLRGRGWDVQVRHRDVEK